MFAKYGSIIRLGDLLRFFVTEISDFEGNAFPQHEFKSHGQIDEFRLFIFFLLAIHIYL